MKNFKKYYCIYERDIDNYTQITLRKVSIFGKKNQFDTNQDAINYIDENPKSFNQNIEYLILLTLIKKD